MTYVTRESLFKTPIITKVISEIDTPGSLFQRFYGLTPGGTQSIIAQGSTASWDLFHSTRSIGTLTARRTGPTTRNRKPYGNRVAQMVRIHEKMIIPDEDLMRYRAAGQPIGTFDQSGQRYVGQQLSYFSQIFRNTREWTVSRMFRGGFGFASNGESFKLTEAGAGGNIGEVDYGIPAAHKNQLGGIIATSWNNAAAEIVSQLMNLEKYAARVNGRPPRHIWLNGTTGQELMNNTQLTNVRGTAMRIFDTLTRREIDPNSRFPDTGYDIIFGALPQYTFHVYNAGLVAPGTSEDFSAQINSSNFQYFIPDEYAIITPDPGDWCGMMEGTEYYRRNVADQNMEEARGMQAWSTPVIDPSGQEIKMLDNFLPVIYEPYAMYYAKVIF